MIDVLHICNEIGLGGTERGIVSMCRTMRYDVFRHSVYCLRSAGDRAMALEGLAAIHVGSPWDLHILMSSRKYSVVIIHRAGRSEPRWSVVLSAIARCKVPAVIEVNIFGLVDDSPEDEVIDSHLHISKSSYSAFRDRAVRQNYSRIARHRVMYIPTDIHRFTVPDTGMSTRSQLRALYDLAPDDFVLLRTGRPDVRKWGDLLLDALPILATNIPSVKFIFLSAPASRAWYMRRSSFASRVRLLPATSDDRILATAYSVADVYVHSSRRGESFGVSLVEAMASRLPVVVNSTPWRDNAQIEVVDHGITGLIANSAQTFAGAVQYLLLHPDERSAMGESGRQKAIQMYDSDVVCRSLAALIVQTLREKQVFHAEADQLQGEVRPTREEIEYFWRFERTKREHVSWQGVPARRLSSPLKAVTWGLIDTVEVVARKCSPILRLGGN